MSGAARLGSKSIAGQSSVRFGTASRWQGSIAPQLEIKLARARRPVPRPVQNNCASVTPQLALAVTVGGAVLLLLDRACERPVIALGSGLGDHRHRCGRGNSP
jgi:hypothetical protein